ncbi:MAG: hypothetical protein JXQ79_06770 [Rhodobacteraceae bacterium]|nr:hypothetical protein [Paracoccaceae bacterium]
MTEPAFSDEILMAFADGELDDSTAEALLAALPGDPALAKRLDLFLTTREALAPQAPPEPVPDALLAQVQATLAASRTDNVVPFARPPAAPAPRWQPMALAASIALAVGLGAGFWASGLSQRGPGATAQADLLGVPGLDEALASMASGEARDLGTASVTVVASFVTQDQQLCREVEIADPSGADLLAVLCHDAKQWQTRLVLATAARDGASYTPASALETLDVFLGAVGAGAPMSPEAEAQALGQLPSGRE